MTAEKANADAITAEIAAREAAITALNADVTSEDGDYVTVKVTEVGGVITAVNVTESGIASAQELATEKKSREDADNAINDKIGTVGTGTTIVEMINAEAERATKAESDLAKRVTANETSINTLKGDAATEGSVAYAVAAETTRAQDVESGLDSRLDTVEGDYLKSADKNELSSAIAAEKTRAEGAESGLASRLATIEGDENKVGSIKKALADAKSYTDTQIDGLTSTKTGDGTNVDVTVAQKNGVITAVTVSESDIASAAVLAKVKGDVDKFFKDASFTENAKDTLKELQDYITSDAAGAATMTQAIADNKKAIEDEVNRATAAEQENTNAIATLNGTVETDGSVAKAVADAVASEKTRAMAAEKANADAITAETQNRINAINALNANVNSTGGSHVIVNVTEVGGVITAVNVTESDIASANELDALKAAVGTGFSSASTVASAITANQTDIAAETTARTAADNAINAKIGEVESDKTVVDMINEAKAAAIAASTVVAENSEFITIEQTGEVGKTQTYTIKTQDVASATATTKAINDEVTRAKAAEQTNADAIAAEVTRAKAAEQANADAIVAEKTRAEGVESGLDSRLATVEGDYVKSVEAAEGSMITVSDIEQKVTLSLQWGTF